MSGFYVINRFFGLDTSATLDDVRKATDAFCAMEWDSVLARHKDELAVETYCFRGAYVLSLLMRGMGEKGGEGGGRGEGGGGGGGGGSDDDSRVILGTLLVCSSFVNDDGWGGRGGMSGELSSDRVG